MKNLSTLVQNLRTDYKTSILLEENMPENPLTLFEQWIQEAVAAQIPDPNAFTIATVSVDGQPSSRIVLLRSISEQGLCFYTNYQSHKGMSLMQNPYTAMTFFWPELERQIRIEGKAEKVPASQSDEYFNNRPRESQLGAWASSQSHIIKSRKELEDNVKFYEEKFHDHAIPRPPHWGGFCITPHYYEFWQGRASRLHDRLAYTIQNDKNWLIARLSP